MAPLSLTSAVSTSTSTIHSDSSWAPTMGGRKPKTPRRRNASESKGPKTVNHRLTPTEVAENLRQVDSASKRTNAVVTFAKYLRREDRFPATWNAIGGAEGVAELMVQLSVSDLSLMCMWLGRTTSATKARLERQTALGELVTILRGGSNDPRPLLKFYQDIVPACLPQFAQAWDDSPSTLTWTPRQQKILLPMQRRERENGFLDNIFSADEEANLLFSQYAHLIRGNLPLSEAILVRLSSASTDDIRVPNDFVDAFVMPLLKRLSRGRRSKKDTFNKFLGLVVHCFEQQPRHLRNRLHFWGGGLVQYVMQQWVDTREHRELIESYLAALISVVPGEGKNLDHIRQVLLVPRRLDHTRRYHLLHLMLENMQGYCLDIEDPSPATSERLKSLSSVFDLWPTDLFFEIETSKSLALLTRLERLHRGESFLSRTSRRLTVLDQGHAPSDTGADLEIATALLQQRLVRPTSPTWLEDVRAVVQDRMTKATEDKEPRDRAFWAKSTINLCVAAGDLEELQKVLIWAQRFTRDPVVGPDVYGRNTLGTKEMETLLVTALPVKHPRTANPETASAALANVVRANNILVTLTQTVGAVIGQPGYKKNKWDHLISLPRIVLDQRAKDSKRFRQMAKAIAASNPEADPDAILVQELWKPTIDVYLEIELLLRDASIQRVVPHEFVHSMFMFLLPPMKPSLFAELTRYYLERVEACYTPSMIKTAMPRITQLVSKLAHSDQPALAIPFIRRIVRNGSDSSWHRDLLNINFLHALPAGEARKVLLDTAGEVAQLMASQNRTEKASPTTEGEAEAEHRPAIKVTVIKMMAQILEGNLLLDPATSCATLVSLLVEARHIDARVAIVGSLLTTLAEPESTPALRKQIIDVLEKHVVPMASQLNERRPTTDEDWNNPDELPKVSEESRVLALLLSRSRPKTTKLRPEDRERVVALVMRCLEASAVDNSRWMHLFLSRVGITLDEDQELPVVPAHLDLLVSAFVQEFHYMPLSLFKMLRGAALANASAGRGMRRVTEAVKADKKLSSSNAGEHWLRQFGKSPSEGCKLGLDQAVDILREGRPSAAGIQAQITNRDLRELVLSAAERWARRGKVDIFNNMVGAISARPCPEATWKGQCLPLLKDMTAMVEGMRGKGLRVVLPNPFFLRLAMLQKPEWDEDHPAKDDELAVFAGEVLSLVDRLAARRGPYHEDFAQLKTSIINSTRDSPDAGRFAVGLARARDVWDETEPELEAYLRLELAAGLLERAPTPRDEQSKGDIWPVLEEWKGCANEELRAMGLGVWRKLSGKSEWRCK